MKSIYLVLICIASAFTAGAQHKEKLYDTAANAEKDIRAAIHTAAKQNKHVLIMGGGNWCSWCYRFNDFITKDKELDSIVKTDYVLYHLNYSKENHNTPTFTKFGFPQRFGFPVFLVLDQKGDRLHTQNSGLLELDKGYSKEKVKDFLLQWNRTALDPVSYKE